MTDRPTNTNIKAKICSAGEWRPKMTMFICVFNFLRQEYKYETYFVREWLPNMTMLICVFNFLLQENKK